MTNSPGETNEERLAAKVQRFASHYGMGKSRMSTLFPEKAGPLPPDAPPEMRWLKAQFPKMKWERGDSRVQIRARIGFDADGNEVDYDAGWARRGVFGSGTMVWRMVVTLFGNGTGSLVVSQPLDTPIVNFVFTEETFITHVATAMGRLYEHSRAR